MNAASIAMAASLFNDKSMAPPAKSRKSPVLLSTIEISSDSFEADSLPEDSMTSTVHVPADHKPEEFKDDEDDDLLEEGDENVNSNGTGLIMYVTSTATKAPYWKRRLGWKPNTARAQRQKLKNLFRTPSRRQATVGLSHADAGDALLLKTEDSNQLQSIVSDRELVLAPNSTCKERAWDAKEACVIDNHDDQSKNKKWQVFHAVNHEFVFA